MRTQYDGMGVQILPHCSLWHDFEPYVFWRHLESEGLADSALDQPVRGASVDELHRRHAEAVVARRELLQLRIVRRQRHPSPGI